MTSPLIPVFDLGGVFIDWNPMYLFRKLFDTEEQAQWFYDNVCTPDWNLAFDAGVSYAEGVTRKCAEHPKYWREIQAFDARWEEMTPRLFEGTMAIHDELIAAGLPTYAITNFSWEKWGSMLGKWPFLEKFDGVVVSGIEKIVKPDLRIYQIFCERYGFEPAQCVFIDDNPHNVEGAEKFGMKALRFTSSEQLRNDLVSLGLPLKN